MSASGQTNPSTWSRIQRPNRAGRTRSPPSDEGSVQGRTATYPRLGDRAVEDAAAGDQRAVLGAPWFVSEAVVSRPQAENASTRSRDRGERGLGRLVVRRRELLGDRGIAGHRAAVPEPARQRVEDQSGALVRHARRPAQSRCSDSGRRSLTAPRSTSRCCRSWPPRSSRAAVCTARAHGHECGPASRRTPPPPLVRPEVSRPRLADPRGVQLRHPPAQVDHDLATAVSRPRRATTTTSGPARRSTT